MPEQGSDELDSDTSREQTHREGVPQAVSIACGTELRRTHVLLEDIADGVMLQWSIGATCPQEELRMTSALSAPIDREILPEPPDCFRREGQGQGRARLALCHAQRPALPVD